MSEPIDEQVHEHAGGDDATMGAEPSPAYPPSSPYQPAGPIDCCPLLRAKSMYYRSDERPGRLHASDVMHYWCEITHTQVGPDKKTAHPLACQPGRGCCGQR